MLPRTSASARPMRCWYSLSECDLRDKGACTGQRGLIRHVDTDTAPHDRPPSAESAELRQTEIIVSYVLRGGVIVSAAVIALGVVLFYIELLAGRITSAAAQSFPHSFHGELAALLAGSPIAVIVLGLLLLLITPVTRVAVSIVVFALEHDRLYTVITAIVLLILLLSFLSGRGGA